MKKLTFFVLIIMSSSVSAELVSYCGDIDRFRLWAGGSDTYGIWVEYENNPSTCEGGFYLPHESDNKGYVVSFLLSEKAQNNRVCMQVHTNLKISNRCRVNYVYNP